ncbi:MAG: hypothetical protein HQL23_01055 [Candidatus Omnitrophica bacterium]|nr:hypothetical protein [Candidatus Omnitrophota bacterium]
MKKQLILIGGGGHCRSCMDVIRAEGRFAIAGIVDPNIPAGAKVLEAVCLGSDADLPVLAKKYAYVLLTIGHPLWPDTRIKIFQQLRDLGAQATVTSSLTRSGIYIGTPARIMKK